MDSDSMVHKLNRFFQNAGSGTFRQIEGRNNFLNPRPKDFTLRNDK